MSKRLIFSLCVLIFFGCCTTKNKKTKVDLAVPEINQKVKSLSFPEFFSSYCNDSLYQKTHTTVHKKEGRELNNFYCRNEFVWGINLTKSELLDVNEKSDTVLLCEYSFLDLKTTIYSFVRTNENWSLNNIEVISQLYDTLNHNSFFPFLNRFAQDSSFQISRVKFPIKRVENEGYEADYIEYIEKDKWQMMKIWLDVTYYPSKSFWGFYTKKEQLYNLIDESNKSIVVSALGVETGVRLYLYFVFENGNWYLTEIEDRST